MCTDRGLEVFQRRLLSTIIDQPRDCLLASALFRGFSYDADNSLLKKSGPVRQLVPSHRFTKLYGTVFIQTGLLSESNAKHNYL